MANKERYSFTRTIIKLRHLNLISSFSRENYATEGIDARTGYIQNLRIPFFFFIFLLSVHILCKESIVIVKKFDFEILTCLYVFRSAEFMYTIFTVMCVCMFVCVCMRVNMIASKRYIQLSSNLVCILQVAV